MRKFELNRSVDAIAVKGRNSSSKNLVRPLVLYSPFVVTPLIGYNVLAAAANVGVAVNLIAYAGVVLKTAQYIYK